MALLAFGDFGEEARRLLSIRADRQLGYDRGLFHADVTTALVLSFRFAQ